MKNGLKSIGKAALYFSVYAFAELLIRAVSGVVLSAELAAETMATGQALDSVALHEQLMAKTIELTTLVGLLSGLLALLIYGIIFLVRKKKLGAEIGLKKIDVKSILPIVLMGVALNIVMLLVINVIPFPESWRESLVANSGALQGGNVIINWISVVIMAPVIEEVVFRGLIYTRLKKGMPALAAAILSAVVFGLMHGTVIWVLSAFVLGMILVWCEEKYQSLAASILFHAAYNLTGQLLALLPVSDVIW